MSDMRTKRTTVHQQRPEFQTRRQDGATKSTTATKTAKTVADQNRRRMELLRRQRFAGVTPLQMPVDRPAVRTSAAALQFGTRQGLRARTGPLAAVQLGLMPKKTTGSPTLPRKVVTGR